MLSCLLFKRRREPEKISVRAGRNSGARHVSSHSPHRVGSALFAALILLGSLSATRAIAEEKTGDALQLSNTSTLYEGPDETSNSLGKLPKGTIVSNRGEKRGKFILVEVELEGGNLLEGWVAETDIFDPDAPPAAQEKEEEAPRPKPKKKMKKVAVPKDEIEVIRRDPTFFYGASAGGDYSFFSVNVTGNNAIYANPGFTGAGFLGFYLDESLPVRFEVGFTQINGVTSTDTANLSFNFLDLAIIPSYVIGPIELFAGIEYSVGLGLQALPSGITLTSPSQLSGVGALGGVGYRWDVASLMTIVFRGKYSVNFNRSYFMFNVISGTIGVEFRG